MLGLGLVFERREVVSSSYFNKVIQSNPKYNKYSCKIINRKKNL